MLQAESLHREVALLSNSLHSFHDSDVAGVKPVINEIFEKREMWRKVRMKIDHVKKFGSLPEEKIITRNTYDVAENASIAEIQVQLQNCQNLIRNKRHKLKNNPDSANSQKWAEELAVLELQESELKSTLIQKKYERA